MTDNDSDVELLFPTGPAPRGLHVLTCRVSCRVFFLPYVLLDCVCGLRVRTRHRRYLCD